MTIYQMPSLTAANGADGAAVNASNLNAPGFDNPTASMVYTTRGGKKAIVATAGSQVIQKTALSTRYLKQRALIWFDALWSGGDLLLVGVYHSGGGAYSTRLIVNTASDLRLQANIHSTVTQATATQDHPVGAWVLLEHWTDAGTATANSGKVQARAYLESDKSLIFDSGLKENINTSAGSGVLSTARFLSNTIAPIRDLAYATDTDATTIGSPWWPSEPNSAPVANAGPDITVDAGQSFTLTGSYTDADNNVTAREWRQGATVVATGDTYTTTAPIGTAGTSTVYTYRVTDSAAAVGTDTVTVTTRAADGRIKVGGVMRPFINRITIT